MNNQYVKGVQKRKKNLIDEWKENSPMALLFSGIVTSLGEETVPWQSLRHISLQTGFFNLIQQLV